MHYYLAFDLGTTHIKAMVCREEEVIGEFKRTVLSTHSQPGYHEQDSHAILDAFHDLCTDIHHEYPHISFHAICFSAAMHGVMMIDKDNRPITPLLTWADSRSDVQAERMKGDGLQAELYGIINVPIHPMLPLCKIAWWKENDPGNFEKASRFVSMKEWLLFQLTNEWVVDYSVAAATGLFDQQEMKWNEKALHVAGIGESHLSKPVSPFSKYVISDHAPEAFKTIAKDAAIIVGGSDGCMAAIGSGSRMEDAASLTVGTSGALRLMYHQKVVDPQQRLFSYRFDKQNFLVGGASNNGGLALQWLMKEIIKSDDYDAVLQRAASIPAGSDGLVCLPYVYGERAPVWNAKARAAFIGLTAHHGTDHLCRALLEGMFHSFRMILESINNNGIAVTDIHASGGFFSTEFLLQLLANQLGCKVHWQKEEDSSLKGAIMIARWAMNGEEYIPELTGSITGSTLFVPNAKMKAGYDKDYAFFISLLRLMDIQGNSQ